MFFFSSFSTTALLASALAAVGVEAIVRGVNLGGWLVTEPWMTPTIFNATATVDEWNLCNVLGKDECLKTLQSHWSTFYTRDDFVAIQNAGLNAVRIPLGYWAVDVKDYEPYVSGQYPYLIQAVQWAGELGLKVLIDIHGAPGSQNGWEETGLVGPVLFTANSSNSERTVNVLQNLTKEFTQSQYGGVVTNIELLNEPLLSIPDLETFYKAAAPVVNVTGINVTIHDGFYEPHSWANYNPANSAATAPATGLVVDTHQFWAFPPLNNLSKPEILTAVCAFGKTIRDNATTGTPPTIVGEWSLSTGVTANSTVDAGDDQDKRSWFRELFEAQNAAFTPYAENQPSIGWYFWAWKTEYDIDAWSYRKGLQFEYIPSNISNASTYAFPILSNGCIDTSVKYTSPATFTSTTTSPTSATGTNAARPVSTSAKKSSASGKSASRWLMASLGGFSLISLRLLI